MLEGSDIITSLCLNKKTKKITKTICSVALLLLFLFLFSYISAIAGTANTAQGSVNDILPILKAISVFFNPLCVLGTGLGIIQMVLSRDTRTAQGAIRFIKMAIFAFIVFNCLGAIVAYVDSLGIKNFYSFNDQNLSNIVGKYTTT